MSHGRLAFFLGVCLSAAVTFWTLHEPAPPLEGSVADFVPLARPLPEIRFQVWNAQPQSLPRDPSRVTLINFWATWCPPCIEELPSLLRLQRLLADEPFDLITISVDKGANAVVETFLKDHQLSDLRVWFDPEAQSLAAFEVRGLPTTLLVVFDQIQGVFEGPTAWDTAEAIALIRHYYPSS